MSRKRIRFIWCSLLIIIGCLPLLVFFVYDSLTMNQSVVYRDSSEQHEIVRNHPVIASLYSHYYADISFDLAEQYNIKNNDYSSEQIIKIQEIQSYFDKEINELLELKVFPSSLIELTENERFQTTFGYISDYSQQQEQSYYLHQMYRIHTNNDVDVTYTYDIMTQKILSISLTNKLVNQLTEEQLKIMSWNMICYLELDDIDDWEYKQNAYQSDKASLIVNSHINHYSESDTLSIEVMLKDSNYLY